MQASLLWSDCESKLHGKGLSYRHGGGDETTWGTEMCHVGQGETDDEDDHGTSGPCCEGPNWLANGSAEYRGRSSITSEPHHADEPHHAGLKKFL